MTKCLVPVSQLSTRGVILVSPKKILMFKLRHMRMSCEGDCLFFEKRRISLSPDFVDLWFFLKNERISLSPDFVDSLTFSLLCC
jgi:hypothetical protein